VDLSHLHHGDVTEAVALAVQQAGALADLARGSIFPSDSEAAVAVTDLLLTTIGEARELLTPAPERFRGRYDGLPEAFGGIRKPSYHETGLAVAVAVLHAAYDATDTLLWSRVLAGEVKRFDHALIGERWVEVARRLAKTAPVFDANELAAWIRDEAVRAAKGQPSGAADAAAGGNGQAKPPTPKARRYTPPNCPRCGERMKVRSTQPAVRYLVCTKWGRSDSQPNDSV